MQSVASSEGGGATGADMHGLEVLLRAMAGGNQAALSSLYEQTVGQVYAIALRVLRCKEDAEEVVCDVYSQAWHSARSFDSDRGPVMAWLAVMARNRAVDRLRQRRDVLSLDDERHAELAASLAGEAPGPDQVLAKFQEGSAVHRALESISAQRRQLLGMAFFQGLSHQEIADATRIPLGTVKSHLRRALAALQGRLSGDA
jgi:RNA polymerase sigma-70 factor (ECF subfamily)